MRRNPSYSPTFPEATFSILDMRFFHHFLTAAYPHLPVDNDHVWVNEIPQLAEQHEYLMHALLSLGASHLSRLTGIDYRRESLTHRGQAIAGLNHALSQPACLYGADAMLASCYALAFQASHMGDGLSDFITMIRGCALTTEKIKEEQAPTAFRLQPDWHFKDMAPRLQDLPPVEPELLVAGCNALDDIRPFLSGSTEIDFHTALNDVLISLQISPASGYEEWAGVYAVWYQLCHDSFKTFLDPNNLVAQLLLAYFVGVQLLMVPLAIQEGPHRTDSSRLRVLQGTIEWAQGIFDRLEESVWSKHLSWPKLIIAAVTAEINGDMLHSPSVLQLHLTSPVLTPSAILLDPV
jgi:hypothetical protein